MKILVLTVIACFGIVGSVGATECFYAPKPTKEDPEPGVSSQGDCGEIVDDDFLDLEKRHFERLSFSEDGLAWVWVDDKVFYVSRTGKAVRTHFYDNGPDYFEEGLARTILGNKFGYMDGSLTTVIQPKYDFAFPFRNGHAVVCNECRSEPSGEHSVVVGGKWGVIDKKGKVVIPVKFEGDELKSMSEFERLNSDGS